MTPPDTIYINPFNMQLVDENYPNAVAYTRLPSNPHTDPTQPTKPIKPIKPNTRNT